MQEEQESPNSQDFYAVNPSEFGVHLWSNALYVLALLLREFLTGFVMVCRLGFNG